MNFYETLGITKKATQEEIKAAYRKRSQETHPDAGGDNESFQNVAASYEVLKDPTKRAFYDRNNFYDDRFEDDIKVSAAAIVLAAIRSGVRDPIKAAHNQVLLEVSGLKEKKHQVGDQIVKLKKSLGKVQSENKEKKDVIEGTISSHINSLQGEFMTLGIKIIYAEAVRDFFDGVSWMKDQEDDHDDGRVVRRSSPSLVFRPRSWDEDQ